MDCLVQQPIWTGAYHHGGLAFHHLHHFTPYYFPRKRNLPCSFYSGSCGLSSSLDDKVGFPADIKLESTNDCMPEDDKDFKVCVVCGEKASGFYFGALVCLPCKSFYIRCTKDGEPTFTCQCNGNCDIAKQGRIRCQYCRYQRCIMAGMCRKEKPETVQPAEGQVLCKVCGDIANGIHFGVNTCEGCKKFFRRGLVENQGYNCKGEKSCQINPRNRNNCRYCRYQKCINAGMSREAIKMGRPKKSDGDSPQQSPSHSSTFNDPHSPEVSPQGSPHSLHNSPQMSPVNESMFQKYMMSNHQPVKTETTCPPPSCQIQSEMTTSRPVLATTPFMNLKTEEQITFNNWTSSTQNGIMSSQCQPVITPCVSSVTSSHPVETSMIADDDDMDDILNFIQMDQASRRADQTDFTNYRDGSSCLYQSAQQNCSMVSNQLAVNTCQNYQNSGPNSPYQHYTQQNQGSFYPNSHSPQYFQQQHSPQTDCQSPQSYHQQSQSISQTYQASSPQTGCHSPQSYHSSSPQSYHSSSPQSYHAPSPPTGCHSPQAYNVSAPTTDYPQMNGYVPVLPNIPAPTQMGNFNHAQQEDIYMDADSLGTINQMFIKCMGRINEVPNQQNSGTITSDQLSSEVIIHSLKTAASRNNDCLYSSSEDSSSHDSTDYTIPTSNKRKFFNGYEQSCSYGRNPYESHNNSNDFICENYSLQSTQNYWKQQFSFEPSMRMTDEDRSIFDQIVSAYSTLRVFYDESQNHGNWNMNKEEHWPKMGRKEHGHWNHVQERIIRNTKAYVDFCVNIPGFEQLDPTDRHDLCQGACFQAALIICSSEWYNRALKKFQYFWNWTVSPENPMYLFKLHLLQAGEAINKLNLSQVELSFVMALCCVSADLTNLKDPDSVERIRRHLVYLLQQHLAEQGINPNERLQEIFSVMPMARHVTFWHKQLMKNMRINIELSEVSKLVEDISL